MLRHTFIRATQAIALSTLVVLGACSDEDDVLNVNSPQHADVQLGMTVSGFSVPTGERVSIGLEAAAPEGLVVGGVQGYLRFDASRLRYVGQLADKNALVIVNESKAEQGEIRLASFHPTGLQKQVAAFAFEVRDGSYTQGLKFDIEVVADEHFELLRAKSVRALTQNDQLQSPAAAVRWTHNDWVKHVYPEHAVDSKYALGMIPGLPAEGTVYGDVNLDGIVNVQDAADVANVGVGNREILVGTDAPARDRVTAANVRPNSLATCGAPGFDAASASVPACSQRTINVSDAGPIAREGVGVAEPIIGDPIALPRAYQAGDTVHIPAGTVIAGNSTRVFSSDSIYVLDGLLTVGVESAVDGNAGTLVVEPGTTVLGANFSTGAQAAIFVTRNGRLISDGTPTQPITFSCTGVKAPQCWGGVFIAGNAVLNDDKGLGTPAPAIFNRNGGGDLQQVGEGGAVNFGGDNDADSSGVIRYTRFMYGGRNVSTNSELNNLTIGACGTGTKLEYIQVHAGSDDGLELFGGRCNVRYLYATGNDDDQFDYSFGYDGLVQFVLIQHKDIATTGGDRGFEVDNTENSATYGTATPRVSPQVYNVTIVGGTSSSEGSTVASIFLRRGASSTLRNVLIMNATTAFVFANQAQTCAPFDGGAPTIDNYVLLSVTNAASGNTAECASAVGPNGQSIAYQGQLKAPLSTTLPDFRPVGSGISGATATPPSNGFFDTGATYFGAVAPVDHNGGPVVPWYAGWTAVWQGATTL